MMTTKVTSFTPVVTGNSFFDAPAFYLSLPGCRKEIAVLKISAEKALGNESQACSFAPYETTWIASAFKIITYILSLGLLPALAALWVYATRSDNQFHYDAVEERRAPQATTPLPGPQPVIREIQERSIEEVDQEPPIETVSAEEQQANTLAELTLVEILEYLQEENPEINSDILKAEVIQRAEGDPFSKTDPLSEARKKLLQLLTEDLNDIPLQELIDKFEIALPGNKPMDYLLAAGLRRSISEQLKQLDLKSLIDLLTAKGWMENIYDPQELRCRTLEHLIKDKIIDKLNGVNPFAPDSGERTIARENLEAILNPSSVEIFD